MESASLITGPLLVLSLLTALFAPRAEPWPHWDRYGSQSAVDHAAWDAFLARYRVVGADGIARVRYQAVTAADRASLQRYIADLQTLRPTSLTRDAALAYWLNLYNAATVQLIITNAPVKSIRDIKPGLFAIGPWSERILTIDGLSLSLNAIEHRILRPHWRDPRIHYGLNCASLGCPDLPATAFRAETVQAQLDAAARAFIAHPRAVTRKAGRVHVSSLYIWFKADFDADGGVLAHIRRYASPDHAALLGNGARIGGDDYDWRLNDAR
jgi:hypothetical protein